MYSTLADWLEAHPVLRGALWMVLLALAGTFVNWVTYKRSDAEWELYQLAHPRRAMLIRVCRAVFPHLRKIPQLAALFPPDDPSTPNRFERATPPVPTPPDRTLMIALAMLVTSTGCSWFRSSPAHDPPPAQAAVLYAAKAIEMANAACAAEADKMVTRATHETDDGEALVLAKKGKALNKECGDATATGRTALEAVEKSLETGNATNVGCALKRGLMAAHDVCAFMRSAKVGKCPSIVDSAITFGSPLLAAVGACPIKEAP